MFFPPPLPEVIFRGTLRRSRPKSAIFGGLGSQLGSKLAPWSATFDQKGSQFLLVNRIQSVLEPTQARFGAENAPRTQFSSIWDVFWSILEGFWINLGWIFDVVFIILVYDF